LSVEERKMGIVQQQTLRGAAWSYLGALLGFINIALLSPRIFTTGEIGVVQVLISFATILSQFSSLGFINVINRLFPYFRDIRERHNGFFALALSITLAGLIITLIFLKFYTPQFEENNIARSPLISQYSFYLPALLTITLLFNLFDNYSKVLYDAVLGTFLKEFLFRLINFAMIILFWFGIIDFDGYMLGYLVSQGVPLIVITFIMVLRKEISLKFNRGYITPELRKQILLLSLFGTLTGLSGYVLTTLDKMFINQYLGESQVGIYSIASYFAVLIMIPGRSVAKISIPFMAELWKKEDLKTVDDIYLRSSINQYAVGLLIFIGLMVNLGNIFRILPEEYGSSYAVIVLIGLGNLVNVSAGINGVVLSTSALYRYQTWLMFILIGLFVISSLVFIPLMGITGAAVASMISNAIYNLLCVGVVGWKYSLWPYRMNHLWMTIVAAVAFVAGTLVPEMPLLPDLMIRSGLVTFVFTAGLYLLKLSDDMNKMADVILSTIRKGFRQS
jgi:O-antigen/teichoic acid export membrane protein